MGRHPDECICRQFAGHDGLLSKALLEFGAAQVMERNSFARGEGPAGLIAG